MNIQFTTEEAEYLLSQELSSSDIDFDDEFIDKLLSNVDFFDLSKLILATSIICKSMPFLRITKNILKKIKTIMRYNPNFLYDRDIDCALNSHALKIYIQYRKNGYPLDEAWISNFTSLEEDALTTALDALVGNEDDKRFLKEEIDYLKSLKVIVHLFDVKSPYSGWTERAIRELSDKFYQFVLGTVLPVFQDTLRDDLKFNYDDVCIAVKQLQDNTMPRTTSNLPRMHSTLNSRQPLSIALAVRLADRPDKLTGKTIVGGIHSISVLFCKDSLVFSNAGDSSNEDKSPYMHFYKMHENPKNIFNCLPGLSDPSTIVELNVFEQALDKLVDEGKLTLVKRIFLKPQRSGNCSWRSVENSTLALLSLLHAEHDLSDSLSNSHTLSEIFLNRALNWFKLAQLSKFLSNQTLGRRLLSDDRELLETCYEQLLNAGGEHNTYLSTTHGDYVRSVLYPTLQERVVNFLSHPATLASIGVVVLGGVYFYLRSLSDSEDNAPSMLTAANLHSTVGNSDGEPEAVCTNSFRP